MFLQPRFFGITTSDQVTDSTTMRGKVSAAELRETEGAYGRSFWLAYFANTLLIVCMSTLFRYFDFVRYLGGDELDLGWITGCGMLGAVIARFGQGKLIDRLGPRFVWLWSLVILIVSLAGHLWVTRIDGPEIYLLRMGLMVGLAGAFGASITSISLKAPRGRTAELIGVLGSSGFIGLAIGPIIGDALFSTEQATIGQIRTMFLLAIVAVCLSWVLTYLATWGDRPGPPMTHPPVWKLIGRYQPGWMLLMAFAMGIGVTLPHVFLRSFAQEMDIPGIRNFFLIYALTAFSFRLATRRLPEKMGVNRAATLGVMLLAGSMLLYLVAVNQWLLPIPAFLGGVAHALLFPAIVGGGSVAFPRKYRGTGTNLMLAMLDLGALVGQPAIGTLIWGARKADLPPYPTMFLCVAAVLLIAATLHHFLARPVHPADDDEHFVATPEG